MTPELLTFIFNTCLPYDRHASVDFVKFGRNIFLADDLGPGVREKVWPALVALSKTGLDRVPDLGTFLPHPNDPAFPEQCLGLQLLLDVCPRFFFRGVDGRWTNDYFCHLSERLGKVWHALPAAQRPDAWERWREHAGLDYWICLRFWFSMPFVHSERADYQEIALGYTEETRTVIERESGQTDPWRSKREEILADLTGFPRVYRAGPPQGKDVTPASWAFWAAMLMDIHVPIIRRFNRYPYRNAITGRVSTDEEKAWIEETAHFGETSEDVAKRIVEDVKAGRWTPLGADSLA